MKLSICKMLKRLLPGAISLALVVAFLSWAYEPKPTAISKFACVAIRYNLHFKVSPDGRHLAAWSEASATINRRRTPYFLGVYDLQTQQHVFSSNAVFHPPQFDADGSLVFISNSPSKAANSQLIRMQLGSQQSQVIWEGEGSKLYLSSDSRMLLCLDHKFSTVQVKLIDCRTGQSRSITEIRNLHDTEELIGLCSATFSPDSKHVALQTLERDPFDRKKCHWRWIDAETGLVLGHVELPNEVNTEGLLYASNTSPFSLATSGGERCLVYLKGKEVRVKKDMTTLPIEDFDHTRYSWSLSRQYSSAAEQGIIVGEYIDVLSSINAGGPFFVARHYAICHDIENDDPQRVMPAIFEAWSAKDRDPQHWFYVATLPGPYLVYQYDEGTNGKFQGWLLTIRHWLKIPHEPVKTLHLIDGKTGTFLHQLHIPNANAASLSKDQSKLMILSSSDTHIELRTYDFPLHLPWHLIWGWALGVTAVVVLLQCWMGRK